MKLRVACLAGGLTFFGLGVAHADSGQAQLDLKLTLLSQPTAGPGQKIAQTKFTTKDLIKLLSQDDALKLDPKTKHKIQVLVDRPLPATGFDNPRGTGANLLDLSFVGPKIVILDNGKVVTLPDTFQLTKTPPAGSEGNGVAVTVGAAKTDGAATPAIIKRDDRSLQAFDVKIGTAAKNLKLTLASTGDARSKLTKPKIFLFNKRSWTVTGSMVQTTPPPVPTTPAPTATPPAPPAPPAAPTLNTFLVSGVIAAGGEAAVMTPTTPPTTPQ